MFEHLAYAGIVFAGFLSIMNPISGISIFLTLTQGEKGADIKKIALQSVITAFVIVVIFAVAGNFLLKFFGISHTALRLAGGILVGIIGYEMLQGKQSSVSKTSKDTIERTMQEESSVAIAPLGIPLLAGPAVIITAMNFASGGFANLFTTIIAFALLCVITYYVFVWGKKIKRMLGSSALKVITKMMGLILVFIGTQMFIDGVYSAIKSYPK